MGIRRRAGLWDRFPRAATLKRKKIRWAAEQYLKGERFNRIAEKMGIAGANLWEILNRRSGEEWDLRFHSERLKIDETVTMKIPPLLDDETIKKIHRRAEANRTFNSSQTQNGK